MPKRPIPSDYEVSYRPFSAQENFHNGYLEAWARLVSAGTGGGKTKCGAFEALRWAYMFPGSVGLIAEPTFGMLRRILLGDCLPNLLGSDLSSCPIVKEFSVSDMLVEFRPQRGHPSSKWWLVSLEEPERNEGPNVDYAWLDEFRLIGGSGPAGRPTQETAWLVVTRRLRGSDYGRKMNYPSGLWITTTPDEPGSVLYERFEGTSPNQRISSSRVYRWDIDANINLPEQYKEQVKASHVPGTGLYDRFIRGLFAQVSVGSFGYDSTLHRLEAAPARGVIQSITYGVDFGWTNPSCIVVVGFDGDNRAYVLDEWYLARASEETIIRAALEFRLKYGRGLFICDRSQPGTIEAMRKAGLEAVPDESKRDDGILVMGGRFHKAGDGRPRIYVLKNCVNWIQEVQVYNPDKKVNDHAMDATRYALRPRLLPRPAVL